MDGWRRRAGGGGLEDSSQRRAITPLLCVEEDGRGDRGVQNVNEPEVSGIAVVVWVRGEPWGG